jgi:tagatose 1,6-diphosphate aldolase GatY/KbaY
MPVVPAREIMDRAFAERYGVAAINIVDDLSLEAVLAAATELESPLIVQTSLKTVKAFGPDALYAMWRARADAAPIPVTLHLDHCPDREWISICLRTGWNSVLFDGSELDVAENTRQTLEVVTEAEGYGAQVEGEIETVLGVEDGVGSDEAGTRSRPRSGPRTACTRARPGSCPSASRRSSSCTRSRWCCTAAPA